MSFAGYYCFISKVCHAWIIVTWFKCDNEHKFSSRFLHLYVREKWYDEGKYILDTTTNPVRIFHETFKEHLGETHGISGRCNKIALHLQEYPPHGDAADEVVDA
jgi:alpha-amylase/alpha-mannosidase (GH57 family)